MRIPEDATPHQINLTYKRLAWMVHHNGLRFPAELARELKENGMKRRKKGKKNNNETQSTSHEVTPEALLLIDMGNILDYIHKTKVIHVVLAYKSIIPQGFSDYNRYV